MRDNAPLFTELKAIVRHGSQERRAEIVKRVTALFIRSASSFNEEHVELFDAILNELITQIETKDKFELSIRLAGISNAPRQAVRQLAQDDQIAVAGPLLQYSERLDEPSLLYVAKSKSQQHLLAISYRRQITETITNVLVRRGDREVIRNVAGNSGANLSQFGFSTLIDKAKQDGILAEKISQRSDVPEPLLRNLFLQATRVVQKRLLATSKPDTKAKILRMLTEITNEIGIEASARNITVHRVGSVSLPRKVNIDEVALAKCATEGLYDETVAALSALCRIPVGNMHRFMANKPADTAIVACKVLGFGWSTARAIILMQRNGLGVSAHSLENKYRHFEKLSASAAQDVMRLWHAIDDGHATQVPAQLPQI